MLLLFLSGGYQLSFAQVKPVQVIPQLLQPYSIYLSDYYSGEREKIVVTLLSRDLQKPVLPVRLRMSIEGQGAQVRSKAYADLPLLQLEAGVPLRLSLQDLAPYFHPNNLDFSGLSRSQYQQQGKLPEGLYSFCFEAVEVNTGQVVSQKSCATAWLSLSDPPLVNLPRKGELIPYRDPQNIIFQWTPRHPQSGAFGTEYEFTLVELWDTGIAPEAAFRTEQPLYQVTTRASTLLYGPAEPALLPGRRYGWRVRAKGGIGAETTELFRNSGYTEVHWFTYQADCPAPRQVLARAESGRAEIAWMPDPTAFRYLVEYRELGNTKADQWHKVGSSEPRAMLYELKAGRSYEYRVGSQCGTVTGEDAWAFSPLHRFDMPVRGAGQGLAQCNLEPRLNLANTNPLEALQPGEVIMAGDFPVRLLRVSGQKSFTGTGYVVIPFLGETRVRVQFANIQVNTDHQLIAGVIETVYDASEGQIADVDKVFGDVAGVAFGLLDLARLSIDREYREMKPLMDNIKEMAEQELTNELKDQLHTAVNQMDQAKQQYDQAKAKYNNADPAEKAAAQKQMEEAKKQFEAAQRDVEKVNKKKDKMVEAVTGVIAKAIRELGKEAESKIGPAKNAYEQSRQKLDANAIPISEERTDDSSIIWIDESEAELDPQMRGSREVQGFVEEHKRFVDYKNDYALQEYALTMYARFSTQERTALIGKSLKINGRNLIVEIQEKLNQGQSEKQVISFTKEQLLNYLTTLISRP